jgi:hypothetical protein
MGNNKSKARRLSQERAVNNARKTIPQSSPGNKQSSNMPFTSADDLLKNYVTATAYTSSGHAFEIQSLSPGDYVITLGVPIIRLLISKGITSENTSDQNVINKAIEKLDDATKEELFSSDEFQDIMSVIICRGVISIRFVNKHQRECNPERKEVSVIDRLSDQDRYELFMQIMPISINPEIVTDIAEFPETGEDTESTTGDITGT